MKLITRRIDGGAEPWGELRRRTRAQLAALQTVAEQVSEGSNVRRLPAGYMPTGRPPAWCLPQLLVSVFTARIGRGSAFRLSLPVAHVR
jgi:hypothetical protein